VPNDLLGVPGEVVLDATADVGSTICAIVAALGDRQDRHWDVRRFL
jgi:hypothetical protein